MRSVYEALKHSFCAFPEMWIGQKESQTWAQQEKVGLFGLKSKKWPYLEVKGTIGKLVLHSSNKR